MEKWKNQSVVKLMAEGDDLTESSPIDIIRDRARDLVLKAFNLGWSGPPFSPVELARLLKISVPPNEAIPDARTIPLSKTSFTIEYNPFQKESRINFSIAHEIGHTLFSDCHEQIRNREEDRAPDVWELEFLCDIAASEILLPYAQFSEEANSVPLNLHSLLEISNKYKASLESVFLRFCEVIDKPCAMLVASFKDQNQFKLEVEYARASRASSLKFSRNFQIPKQSRAYECLNAGWTSHGIERWEIFGNTRYTVYSVGLSPLNKLKRQRVGLFIVPEIYNDA